MFDDASDDIKWSRHPVPVIYGFKSYCAFPVYLDDGSFFGTLCAIDPAPRRVADDAIVAMFTAYEGSRRDPVASDARGPVRRLIAVGAG